MGLQSRDETNSTKEQKALRGLSGGDIDFVFEETLPMPGAPLRVIGCMFRLEMAQRENQHKVRK